MAVIDATWNICIGKEISKVRINTKMLTGERINTLSLIMSD
ncbi:MAG: hypothetical protein R3B66_16215 [Candidatus Scalinduaceae bacterium]